MANPSLSLSTSDGIETTFPFWISTPPTASASGATVLAETGWKSEGVVIRHGGYGGLGCRSGWC